MYFLMMFDGAMLVAGVTVLGWLTRSLNRHQKAETELLTSLSKEHS